MRQSELILDENVLQVRAHNTLMFLMTFEHFRNRVIVGVQDFFAEDFEFRGDDIVSTPSAAFREKVLARATRKFEACLIWYEEMGVFSRRDVSIAIHLVDYRNQIAHDPSRVLMGNKYRGWTLDRADRLLRKVDAFWIQVAVETDPEVPNDYDRGSAISVFRVFLNQFSQAISPTVAGSGNN